MEVGWSVFRLVAAYLKKIQNGRKLEDMPLDDLEKAAEFVKPFALKTLPDRLEVTDTQRQDTLALPIDLMQGLLDLASRNMSHINNLGTIEGMVTRPVTQSDPDTTSQAGKK